MLVLGPGIVATSKNEREKEREDHVRVWGRTGAARGEAKVGW